MTLAWIVRRSLRQHAFSTSVTAVAIALATGLLMSVWCVKEQSQDVFTGLNGGFDAVLGARGSKLQLVLNSIFHLESSPGNVAWSDFLEIATNENVQLAVPLAVGDNYHGYRIVGTTPDLFQKAEYAPGKHYSVLPGGRFFDPTLREAVVGSFAARKLGLKLGDGFHPYHGLIFDEQSQHSETYVVVGILRESNTPSDRVIWIPLEGVQKMTGHDPSVATEVSAVLLKLKSESAIAGFQMDMMYNKQGNRLTFAWPIGTVMADLFDKISWFDRVLGLVSYLVAAVATVSVLAGVYNSMNERRREIAILRALGARRSTISASVVLESASISALGVCGGFLVYWVILEVVGGIMRAQTGVLIDPFRFNSVQLWGPAILVGLGALVGLVPACKAYRTDVSENLVPLS